jgi:hypothetical protein
MSQHFIIRKETCIYFQLVIKKKKNPEDKGFGASAIKGKYVSQT